MTEGRAPVRVASPAFAWLADVAGGLLVAGGAVTGLVVHAFWTWLLAGFVAAMLVVLAARLLADAGVHTPGGRARTRPASRAFEERPPGR